jgi:hypothetical protein
MAKLLHLSRPGNRVSYAMRVWWALRCQKLRRSAGTGQVVPPLPVLAHHPHGGLPGTPLIDDIYLAENPGALISDSVEIWVLDPNIVTIHGYPPTESDWVSSSIVELVAYNGGLGRWHYQSAGVGASKTDGDNAWIKGRFRRAGQAAGPWSIVDEYSGAGVPTWSY